MTSTYAGPVTSPWVFSPEYLRPMDRRRLGGALLAVLAILLVGCGDDGSDAADDPAADSDETVDDACDLLSTEDVAGLLDREVEDGESESLDDGTVCQWATVEDSVVVDGPITLDVELGELSDEVETQMEEALADPANEAVDIGDEAVLVCGLGADGDDCDQYDSIAVVVGDQYLEVDLGNWGYPDDYDEDEGIAITEEAARMAVDALG
jgi:hypothetical protein